LTKASVTLLYWPLRSAGSVNFGVTSLRLDQS